MKNETNKIKKEFTQEEKRAFVQNNIIFNQSNLVGELLDKDVFSMDDVENYYYIQCSECGGEVDGETCINCDTHFTTEERNNLDLQAEDVLEWYLVDDWMAGRLQDVGECVLNTDFGAWWGRTCSGQAVYMDSVIDRIMGQE